MTASVDTSLQPITKALNQWITLLKQHYEDYALASAHDNPKMRDGLVEAEVILFLDTFRNLMALMKERLQGRSGLDHPLVHRLIEDKFLFEKLAGLEARHRGTQERLLNKLKQHEISDTMVEEKRLRARPEMFVLNESKNDISEGQSAEEAGGNTGIYKAPKTFAVPYARDRDTATEDMDEEALEKEQERLRRSEFVRAVTEDLLPTPVEVGDGEEELDASSRKMLKKFKAREEYEEENMTRLKRRKSDEKAYMAIKEKQRQLTVGASLSDLTTFVDRIGPDRASTSNIAGDSSRRNKKRKKAVPPPSNTSNKPVARNKATDKKRKRTKILE